MTSLVDLCNLALLRIGGETITDLDEPSATATACRLLVGPARDGVLRAHPWRFAEAAVRLARLGSAAGDGLLEPGWLAYALPGDCLAPRRLGEGQPFRVRGATLLTPAEPAVLIYTARIDDPGRFDPLFITALAARLAADLVMPLQGDRDTQRQAERAFTHALDAARAADARDAQASGPGPAGTAPSVGGTDPDWLTVRG